VHGSAPDDPAPPATVVIRIGRRARGRTCSPHRGPRAAPPRSIALFALAAVCEIGGAWLIWQAVRQGHWRLAAAGGAAPVAYGFVAALQPDANFGRVLAACGGVFVAGIPPLGRAARRLPAGPLRHRRAAIRLLGVAVIMCARGWA
jgi:small multidrug resistance family-3 protein